MRHLRGVVVLVVLLGGLVAGVQWLSSRRQHGTPDHWPPVARKTAAG